MPLRYLSGSRLSRLLYPYILNLGELVRMMTRTVWLLLRRCLGARRLRCLLRREIIALSRVCRCRCSIVRLRRERTRLLRGRICVLLLWAWGLPLLLWGLRTLLGLGRLLIRNLLLLVVLIVLIASGQMLRGWLRRLPPAQLCAYLLAELVEHRLARSNRLVKHLANPLTLMRP